jgi:hypothetical protein
MTRLASWARGLLGIVEDDRSAPKYARAVAASDDLIRRMRDSSASGDPVRAVMADLWQQRHNVPYVTTVYEAVAEMSAAVDQKPAPE